MLSSTDPLVRAQGQTARVSAPAYGVSQDAHVTGRLLRSSRRMQAPLHYDFVPASLVRVMT